MPVKYKVEVDKSTTANNNADAVEKKINEMTAKGWRLAHITSFATSHAGSKIYMFFERDA